MSMTFIGNAGTCETPWIRFALLRDNILHHLDQGALSLQFVSIYTAAGALGGGSIKINAKALHSDMEKAAAGLLDIPANQLAISARTQAVIRFDSVLPIGPPTTLLPADVSLPWVTANSQTLGDVFGGLVRDLLRITENAGELDSVEVIDS